MKNSNKFTTKYIVFIVILLVSLTLTLLEAVGGLFSLFTHPMLNFLLYIFAFSGIFMLVNGITNKSNWQMFLSAIFLSLALFYVLINLLKAWIAILIVVCFVAFIILFSLAIIGNQTENISLNAKPDYKNYQTRIKEKYEAEDNTKKEDVKIKSFKD